VTTVVSRTKKFLSYYKPHLRLLLTDLACASVVAAIALILPLCAQFITKNILESTSPDALVHVFGMGLIMLALLLIHTLCNFFVDYQGHMMGTLMESDMRLELFAHYQTLPFSFYDEQKTGQLMTRITQDVYALGELYHHGPEDILISLVTFSGAFIILMNINLALTAIVLVFLPIMAVYAFYFNRKMIAVLRKGKDRIGDINAQVEDTLAGIRVVKAFTNAAFETSKFAHENREFVESTRQMHRYEGYFFGGMFAFTQLMTIAVIVFGGASIIKATLSLSELITFLLYTGLLIEPIRKALNFARLYQEGITGFNRFMDVLEVQPAIQDAVDARDIGRVRGAIAFRDVQFRYREDQHYVLNKLDLTIQAGEYVALVGPSGVGKTTLISLIPRFYEVTAGAILIDDTDIRTMTMNSLRNNIGVVQQDVYLFAGTVADNIRYGKREASHDEIVEAAKKANAHDFIMALPYGYATDIGQRGVKLSGGQKQRLSIARVFLRDPAILILDEATSALDNESERQIQESLERLTKNRTTLVIAHRLSTIRNAQRILVLSDAGITEQGSHAELLDLDGIYAQLYHSQLRL